MGAGTFLQFECQNSITVEKIDQAIFSWKSEKDNVNFGWAQRLPLLPTLCARRPEKKTLVRKNSKIPKFELASLLLNGQTSLNIQKVHSKNHHNSVKKHCLRFSEIWKHPKIRRPPRRSCVVDQTQTTIH